MLRMAKKIHEYQKGPEQIVYVIYQLRCMLTKQEVVTKALEDFKTYALNIQCELSDVYMKFYLDIIEIKEYNQIFQELVEKGKVAKKKIVEIKGTLEQLIRWHRLHSDDEEDMPRMTSLDREIYVTTCIDCDNKDNTLIEKASQDLVLCSKMM